MQITMTYEQNFLIKYGVARINVCFSFLVKCCQKGWNSVCFLKINEIYSNLVVIRKKYVLILVILSVQYL